MMRMTDHRYGSIRMCENRKRIFYKGGNKRVCKQLQSMVTMLAFAPSQFSISLGGFPDVSSYKFSRFLSTTKPVILKTFPENEHQSHLLTPPNRGPDRRRGSGWSLLHKIYVMRLKQEQSCPKKTPNNKGGYGLW